MVLDLRACPSPEAQTDECKKDRDAGGDRSSFKLAGHKESDGPFPRERPRAAGRD
jgi:hypothetical protein